jgi:hypothetical protein
MSDPIPQDIKACWFNPIRRLQSATSGNKGLAIVTMKFLVNADGVPIQWTEPNVVLLEPWQKPKALLDLLTE